MLSKFARGTEEKDMEMVRNSIHISDLMGNLGGEGEDDDRKYTNE